MPKLKPKTSLYVILARNAPVAVIFRRGPTKRVRLIKWSLADDTFEFGQWFKGRIYERRCDLSPSGDLLVYFAASQRGQYKTWTAVSRPPYLTALALWPVGNTWCGGGRFLSERKLSLDQFDANLADGFSLPRKFTVVLSNDEPEDGSDEPAWHDECR